MQNYQTDAFGLGQAFMSGALRDAMNAAAHALGIAAGADGFEEDQGFYDDLQRAAREALQQQLRDSPLNMNQGNVDAVSRTLMGTLAFGGPAALRAAATRIDNLESLMSAWRQGYSAVSQEVSSLVEVEMATLRQSGVLNPFDNLQEVWYSIDLGIDGAEAQAAAREAARRVAMRTITSRAVSAGGAAAFFVVAFMVELGVFVYSLINKKRTLQHHNAKAAQMLSSDPKLRALYEYVEQNVSAIKQTCLRKDPYLPFLYGANQIRDIVNQQSTGMTWNDGIDRSPEAAPSLGSSGSQRAYQWDDILFRLWAIGTQWAIMERAGYVILEPQSQAQKGLGQQQSMPSVVPPNEISAIQQETQESMGLADTLYRTLAAAGRLLRPDPSPPPPGPQPPGPDPSQPPGPGPSPPPDPSQPPQPPGPEPPQPPQPPQPPGPGPSPPNPWELFFRTLQNVFRRGSPIMNNQEVSDIAAAYKAMAGAEEGTDVIAKGIEVVEESVLTALRDLTRTVTSTLSAFVSMNYPTADWLQAFRDDAKRFQQAFASAYQNLSAGAPDFNDSRQVGSILVYMDTHLAQALRSTQTRDQSLFLMSAIKDYMDLLALLNNRPDAQILSLYTTAQNIMRTMPIPPGGSGSGLDAGALAYGLQRGIGLAGTRISEPKGEAEPTVGTRPPVLEKQWPMRIFPMHKNRITNLGELMPSNLNAIEASGAPMTSSRSIGFGSGFGYPGGTITTTNLGIFPRG